MSHDATTYLLDRINELERRIDREQRRLYDTRRSRDRWKQLAVDRAPDALSWRRWKASASIVPSRPAGSSREVGSQAKSPVGRRPLPVELESATNRQREER